MKEEIESVLNKIRKMSVKKLQEYDIKNEFNDLCDINNNLEKICQYRYIYDCDASLFSMICLWLAYNFDVDEKNKTCTFNCKYIPNKINVIHSTYRKQKKYEFVGNDFNFRGDTMNSYATTFHEFLRCYPHDESKCKEFLYSTKSGKYDTKKQYNFSKKNWELCILDNYNYFNNIISKEIPSANEFFHLTHTIGNMILAPFKNRYVNFNCKRGLGVSKDYFDIALLCMYNDFPKNKNERYTLNKLLNNNIKYNSVELIENWMGKFENWENFIEKNYLNSFVDNNYEPKPLWKGHLEENSNVLPVKDDKINQYEEYFKNASEMIKQRGELIAKKIKNVLDFIPNDKIIEILTNQHSRK